MTTSIKSFSYVYEEDGDTIKSAEKIATDLGLDFSKYVVRCIRADVGLTQKKEDGSSAPVRTEPNDTNDKVGFKLDTQDPVEVSRYINSVSDVSTLRRIQKVGHLMETIAKTRARKVMYIT